MNCLYIAFRYSRPWLRLALCAKPSLCEGLVRRLRSCRPLPTPLRQHRARGGPGLRDRFPSRLDRAGAGGGTLGGSIRLRADCGPCNAGESCGRAPLRMTVLVESGAVRRLALCAKPSLCEGPVRRLRFCRPLRDRFPYGGSFHSARGEPVPAGEDLGRAPVRMTSVLREKRDLRMTVYWGLAGVRSS